MATRPNPFGKETKREERMEMKLPARKYAAAERSEGERGRALKKPATKAARKGKC